MDVEILKPVLKYEILNEEAPRYSSRFHRDEYNYDVGISHSFSDLLPNLLSASVEINSMYEKMVKNILDKYTPRDMYSVSIKHEELNRRPLFICKR